MNKKEFIDYLVTGGIYLWDHECLVQWKNLPNDYLADWLEVEDIILEATTVYAKDTLSAIQSGLCPYKGEYRKWLISNSEYWRKNHEYWRVNRILYQPRCGTDFTMQKFWYFPVGKIIGKDTKLQVKPLHHYTIINFPSIPSVEMYNYGSKHLYSTNSKIHTPDHYSLINGVITKVYAFHSMSDAWRFLFEIMIDREKFKTVMI